jgi:hypothetical protein
LGSSIQCLFQFGLLPLLSPWRTPAAWTRLPPHLRWRSRCLESLRRRVSQNPSGSRWRPPSTPPAVLGAASAAPGQTRRSGTNGASRRRAMGAGSPGVTRSRRGPRCRSGCGARTPGSTARSSCTGRRASSAARGTGTTRSAIGFCGLFCPQPCGRGGWC